MSRLTDYESGLLTDEEYYVDDEWPTKQSPCYDCGSTIAGHHTELCEFGFDTSKRDLPNVPGTQWWTKVLPDGLEPTDDA